MADDDIWQQWLCHVTPLKHKGRYAKPEESASSPRLEKPLPRRPEWREKSSFSLSGMKEAARPDPKELAPSISHKVSRSSAKHLIAGRYPYAASLDLHGYTQEKAFEALLAFIQDAWRKNHRCVLVVTGKGGGGLHREKGVLYTQVPKWLNHPQIKPLVLMFARAQVKDGGEGALYVLLKKGQ